MRCKRGFSGYVALLFLASSAWSGTIQDPAAGVIDDNFSSAISTLGGFDPHLLPNGILGLYNDTAFPLTSLALHTTIATNLTVDDITSSFVCNTGAENPFFINCGFTYVSVTGDLTIRFFGVTTSENGVHEGIPTLNPGCLPTPDAPGCDHVGHFALVFNNGFLTSGALVNGWVPTTTSTANPNTLLFNGQPLFDSPGFTTTASTASTDSPEPSSILLLGGGIWMVAGLARRRFQHSR